ncbi:hypothetical protein [Paraflavitalea speifideaquila]|uniref:hypothetical protein n=1 Tax=Paraflavitalea speifideaquila TaxID=3076558 RepID=UPI003312FBB2
MQHDFRPSNQPLYEELQKGVGRAVVASSRHDQYSRILPHAQYSVFTDALVQALDSGAGNGSQYATLLRTVADVSDMVKKATDALQIPVFDAHGLEDFAICRIDKARDLLQPFKNTAAYLGAVYQPRAEALSLLPGVLNLGAIWYRYWMTWALQPYRQSWRKLRSLVLVIINQPTPTCVMTG